MVTAELQGKAADAAGWATDIHAALTTLELPATVANLCAVMAVIEQESGWRADPSVPGLPGIAWKEIERRADEAGVPMLAVRAALAVDSPDGRSYAKRLDTVKTEGQLSEIFEDFIGMVPLGRRFLADRNPVRTGRSDAGERGLRAGPCRRRTATRTRRPGRSGTRCSRGAVASTSAPRTCSATRRRTTPALPLRRLQRRPLREPQRRVPERAVARVGPAARARRRPGSARRVGAPGRDRTRGADAGEPAPDERSRLRRDLQAGDQPGFEQTTLYERVFAHVEALEARPLPRAVVPRIDLKSPKITRKLTTEWFATRVNERHTRCVDGLTARLATR